MRRSRPLAAGVLLAALATLTGCPIVDDVAPRVPGPGALGASASPGATASFTPGTAPSARPTRRPSAAPTDDPEAEPTDDPEADPTDDPEVEPSEEPDDDPSPLPGDASGGVPAGGLPTVEVLAGRAGTSAQFQTPRDVALAPDGTIFVADAFSHTIRRVSPDGEVTTFAGVVGESGLTDGVGSQARFSFPNGIAIDREGNLLVRESSGGNNTIRAISPAGKVVTLAGRGELPSGLTASLIPGEAAKVRLGGFEGIALIRGGALVADAEEDRIVLLLQDGSIEVFAGGGGSGLEDGQGAAAKFSDPTGLVADAAGNVYVADHGNDAIRKITPTGVVTTLYQAKGDDLYDPTGIALDGAGNLYISDSIAVFAAGQSATFGRIQRLSTDGELTLVYDASEPDAAGREYDFAIGGLDVAPDGSIVFADEEEDRIVRLVFGGE